MIPAAYGWIYAPAALSTSPHTSRRTRVLGTRSTSRSRSPPARQMHRETRPRCVERSAVPRDGTDCYSSGGYTLTPRPQRAPAHRVLRTETPLCCAAGRRVSGDTPQPPPPFTSLLELRGADAAKRGELFTVGGGAADRIAPSAHLSVARMFEHPNTHSGLRKVFARRPRILTASPKRCANRRM